jgi:3-oxoacyl-[acyl-carrier protein] reductase
VEYLKKNAYLGTVPINILTEKMIHLKGRVVLITGGSRGIGAATARMVAAAGGKVSLTFASKKLRAQRVIDEVVRMGSEGLALRVDVRRASQIRDAVRRTVEQYGRLDVLVNNAGIWKRAPLATMTEHQWDETLDVNLKSAFLFTQAVLPTMKKQRYGRIINVASTAGQRGEPYYAHYAASKGGMIAFTKSLAVELAPFNIHVNAVAPGWVDTDMTASVLHRRRARVEIEKGIPRGAVATAEEIAGSILFLASDLADHIIGATININGGGVLSG